MSATAVNSSFLPRFQTQPSSCIFSTSKNSVFFSTSKRFESTCKAGRDRDLSASVMAEGLTDFMGDSKLEAELKLREPSMSTILTSADNSFDPYGAMSTPLYQTSTFHQPSATENGPYDYTRTGNPTRDVLQSLMAKLEKASSAFCFTSGMAALTTVTKLVLPGQEIVAGDDVYGGSDRLLQLVRLRGITVKQVNTSHIDEVESAMSADTKLVWLESPTNPRQLITDIRKISEMAHAQGAIVLVDNSIMSPVLCRPLELGADIVMEAATKFISGHSDVMSGVLAVKDESPSLYEPVATW